MAEYPSIRELLPHAGPMVLLDRVLAHDADATTCAVAIADQRVFRDPDGGVPVWFSIEYMAQCIGVHACLVRRVAGELETPLGFLVGARGLAFHVARFDPAQRLEATVRRRWAGSKRLISFECELRDADSGKVLAEGRVNCFLVPAGGDLSQG